MQNCPPHALTHSQRHALAPQQPPRHMEPKQHQVSCPPWTMGHTGDIVPLFLFSSHQSLSLHHHPLPQLYSWADSVHPPSSSARHPVSISALPGWLRHPAGSSPLPLPEVLPSLSLFILLSCRPSPPLKWCLSIFNGGPIVSSCAPLNGEQRLGVRSWRAEADRSVKDSTGRQLGSRWLTSDPPDPNCWIPGTSSGGSPVTEAGSRWWQVLLYLWRLCDY